jgi:hypothetical protein
MTDVPRDLNWVKELSECSVKAIFSTLHQGAEGDVKEANTSKKARFPGYPIDPFAISSNEQGNYFVVHEQGNTATLVRFSLGPDRIVISAYGKEYVVRPSLNNKGECKLRINGEEEELEEWQVRRRVLERLFFES